MASLLANNSQSLNPPWRRRARKACLSCRKRKMRCDVDRTKPPCNNCETNGFTCELPASPAPNTGAKANSHAKSTAKHHGYLSQVAVEVTDQCIHVESTFPVEENVSPQSASRLDWPSFPELRSTLALGGNFPPPELDTNAALFQAVCGPASPKDATKDDDGDNLVSTESLQFCDAVQLTTDSGLDICAEHILKWSTPYGADEARTYTKHSALKSIIHDIHSCQQSLSNQLQAVFLIPQLNASPKLAEGSDMLETHLARTLQNQGQSDSWTSFRDIPFLECENLDELDRSGLVYLEESGCLQVPTKPLLNTFVREFFLYVQPMTPALDEGMFWRIFSGIDKDDDYSPCRISLFLFQAMLAASSIFLPSHALQACGFHDHQTARRTFCRRASILYDFKMEKDILILTQGTLLLSLIAQHDDLTKGSRFWLTTAIELVKAGRADRRLERSPKIKIFERLWCISIIRDRTMSLEQRRPLQITIEMFDPSMDTDRTLDDYENESVNSLVYDQTTLKQLAKLFSARVRFSVTVSGLLQLTYPLNGTLIPKLNSLQGYSETLSRIESERASLQDWYCSFRQLTARWSADTESRKSILLFAHLLNMSYQAARIALHYHEILIFHLNSSYGNALIEKRLGTARETIYDSIFAVCDTMSELASRGLVRKLDGSGAGFAVLPFKLLEFGMTIDSMRPTSSASLRQLRTLSDSMAMYKETWDGIDRALGHLRSLVPMTNGNSGIIRSSALHFLDYYEMEQISSPKAKWCASFEKHATLYLQLMTALNFCIAKGETVSYDDLPEQLRTRSPVITAVVD